MLKILLFLFIFTIQKYSFSQNRDIIWQIGRDDKSDREFISLNTQDFGGSAIIAGLPGFDKETLTLTYTVSPDKTEDMSPSFPSCLANPYAIFYSDQQPISLRIVWTEKEGGYRRFELHTSAYVNPEKYAGDNYLIQVNRKYQAYLQTPCPVENINHMDDPRARTEKDVDFKITFPVSTGQNELMIIPKVNSPRSRIHFDYLKLVSISEKEFIKPKPTLEVVPVHPAESGFDYIFFPGQSIKLIARAYNLEPGQKYFIDYKIIDLWENPITKQRKLLQVLNNGTGEVTIEENINQHGYFELIAELTDQREQKIELGMARNFYEQPFSIIEPAEISFLENSRFGTTIDCCVYYPYNPIYIEKTYARAASIARILGVRWIRFFLSWRVIEPVKGQFRWPEYDRILQLHQENGLNTLLNISGTPIWANSLPQPKSKFNGIYDPPKMDEWNVFIETLGKRYKDSTHRWEIWNEPGWYPSGFWAGDPALYTELLRNSSEVLKKINPNNIIIATFLPFIPGEPPLGDKFINRMLSVYQNGDFDAYAYHYPTQEHREALKQLMEKYGIYNMPCYNTETSFATRGWEYKNIAADTIKGYIEEAAWGTVQTYYYTILPFGNSKWAKKNDSSWAGMLNWDWSLRPLGVAYRTMTRHLEGSEYIGKIDSYENIAIYIFRKDDKYTLVLWSKDGKERIITLPGASVNTRIYNMMDSLENVNILSDGTSFLTKVNYYPIFIEDIDNRVVDLMTTLTLTTTNKKPLVGTPFQVELKIERSPVSGKIRFKIPDGWCEKELGDIIIKEGEKINFKLDLKVPLNAGHRNYQILAELIPERMKNISVSSRIDIITLTVRQGENLLANNGNPDISLWKFEDDVIPEISNNVKIAKFNGFGKINYLEKIGVIPGEKYIIGIWAKGSAKLSVSIKEFDESGFPIKVTSLLKSENTENYRFFSTVYQVPVGVGYISPFIVNNSAETCHLREIWIIQPPPESEENTFKLNFLSLSPRAKTSPVIDGNLNDWNISYPVYVDRKEFIRKISDWKGQDDLSAIFYTMWDANNFYLAVQVRDDIHFQNCIASEDDKVLWWQDDSIQFGLDPANQAKEEEYLELGGWLSIDKGPTLYRYHLVRTTNVLAHMYRGLLREAKIAIKRDGLYTTYEIAIPTDGLWPLTLYSGKYYGFALLINDNDGTGRRGWLEWGSGIGMKKDPSQYGMVICIDDSTR